MTKRSECTCPCHNDASIMHFVACCEPDEKQDLSSSTSIRNQILDEAIAAVEGMVIDRDLEALVTEAIQALKGDV